MSDEQRHAFLTKGARTAKLATVRADGRPHVAPVWFDVDDDGTLVFTTGATSVKGKALARDPRVALCVDDETPPFSFVAVEGMASLSTDPVVLFYWAARIGGRYMGAASADAYGRRNAVPGELLVRVTPTRVVARTNIAG